VTEETPTCKNPKRYKRLYEVDEKLGNRRLIGYQGLFLSPTWYPSCSHAPWQHLFISRCELCGHTEEVEQYKIKGYAKAFCCVHCPPEVRRTKRPKKKHRSNVHRFGFLGFKSYTRPVDSEALYHLWVHQWMPVLSLRFCDGMNGFDSLRERYLRMKK